MGWFGTDWAVLCLHAYGGNTLCTYSEWLVIAGLVALLIVGHYLAFVLSRLLEAILVPLENRIKGKGVK